MEQWDPTSRAPDVMRAYGKAMYGAQLMEEAIVNLLLARRLAGLDGNDDPGAVEDQMQNWERKTLGNLVNELLASGALESEDRLRALLYESTPSRNRLAHRFLREHLDELISPGEHASLVAMLDDHYRLFLQVAEGLNEVTLRLEPATTLTEQEREQLVTEVLKGLC